MRVGSTEYTEWQGHFLTYIPSLMEKLALAGEGWGLHAHPFSISTITYKVVVYALAERADTLPLFLLYLYMYSVGETGKNPLSEYRVTL